MKDGLLCRIIHKPAVKFSLMQKTGLKICSPFELSRTCITVNFWDNSAPIKSAEQYLFSIMVDFLIKWKTGFTLIFCTEIDFTIVLEDSKVSCCKLKGSLSTPTSHDTLQFQKCSVNTICRYYHIDRSSKGMRVAKIMYSNDMSE